MASECDAEGNSSLSARRLTNIGADERADPIAPARAARWRFHYDSLAAQLLALDVVQAPEPYTSDGQHFDILA